MEEIHKLEQLHKTKRDTELLLKLSSKRGDERFNRTGNANGLQPS